MRLVTTFSILLCVTRPCLSFLVSSPASRRCRHPKRWTLAASSSSKRNLSASERERRDEERRRQERAQDVVIGKTSALPDASDFDLNVQATEQEWMRQASDVEQEVYRFTELGMNALKMFNLQEAAEAFDRVFELRPSAYLWQAGVVKFYLNELEDAAAIFAQSAHVFESKFGEPASEERIWRNACELKLLSSLDKKERKRVRDTGGIDLPNVPENEYTENLLAMEQRKAIKFARDLFDATIENDYSATILSKAKLRSVGGAFETQPRLDIKMWKLNSWFYLGLYYDAIGEPAESKKCMKMALRLCPSVGNGNDIIHTLPMLHMAQRDWFDEEEFDEDMTDDNEGFNTPSTQSQPSQSSSLFIQKQEPDPLVAKSVREGVSELRIPELKDALRVRGIKTTGSKETLQQRLFESLMDDAGLAP